MSDLVQTIGDPADVVTPAPVTYPLRDYQTAAIDSVEKAFDAEKRRVAVVIPTGGGKTVVFAHLIARQPIGARVLVLAHRTELIDQAAAKIRDIAPDRSVGIVRNVEDGHDADVVVASIQTISSKSRLERIVRGFDLVIVDEAHHATARTYREVLDYFPEARAVGVSATLIRSDDAVLGDVWEEVVYRVDILDLIDHQPPYLCDVRGLRVVAEGLDLSTVRTGSDGDYRLGELEEEMTEAGAWAATADAYVRHASDRIGVVFTPTVNSAHVVAELITAQGITAEAVDGNTPKDERNAILARFATGETQVVANCGVLTEGYDNPAISCVAIARPTKSKGLFVQMAGRGLRLHPGKAECLILDLVGTAENKQLATLADLTGHGVGEVRDGQSLREAREAQQTENNTSTPYLGDLTEHEINLFGTSAVTWSSWGDVRFVDVATVNTTAYIAPGVQTGTYDAVLRWRVNGQEKVLAEGLAFRSAVRKAETWVAEKGGALVQRKGGWRDATPSAKQLAMLRHKGITIPAGTTKGQVSGLISDHAIALDFTAHAPRGYTPKAA